MPKLLLLPGSFIPYSPYSQHIPHSRSLTTMVWLAEIRVAPDEQSKTKRPRHLCRIMKPTCRRGYRRQESRLDQSSRMVGGIFCEGEAIKSLLHIHTVLGDGDGDYHCHCQCHCRQRRSFCRCFTSVQTKCHGGCIKTSKADVSACLCVHTEKEAFIFGKFCIK